MNFDGVTVTELYNTFVAGGVPASDAAVMVSSWIYENVGKTHRVFNYVQPFPEVEPACQPPPFTRTFHHDDWVDGEDVVQAGATTGELGFNERFHRIETDLDHLGADVAKAFGCLASMRSALRHLLDEIRAEINRLHDATHEWAVLSPTINLDKVPNYLSVLDFGKYMGTQKFLDRTVSVWQTKQGTLILPAVESLGVDVVLGPKLKNAAMMSRFVAEEPKIREQFSRPFRLDDLLHVFGDSLVADGRTVRDVLKVLPATMQFDGIDHLLAETGEREAAMVRTTMGADSAVSAALGIDAGLERIGDADVAKLGSVPTKARTALTKAGVNTVGALAQMDTGQIVAIMQEAGISATQGDAAEWNAFAKTLTNLGGFGGPVG
jgi:hypothetical protein